jgi:hypothetical protein
MRTALLLITTLIGTSVHAQAVYRCGPDGRSYSQTPCAQGRSVEVNDARSAQQRREAIEVAERDRALGASLQQDRLARESQPHAGAGKIDGRIGYARAAHAEPAKQAATPKKKRSAKTPQHADHGTAASKRRS